MIPLESKLVRPQSRNTERSNLPIKGAVSHRRLSTFHKRYNLTQELFCHIQSIMVFMTYQLSLGYGLHGLYMLEHCYYHQMPMQLLFQLIMGMKLK